MANSTEKLLKAYEELYEETGANITATEYIRANYETITKLLNVSKGLKATAKNGKKVYEELAKAMFEDGITLSNGLIIPSVHVGVLIHNVRKERGEVKTKTVPLAVSSIIPDAPISSKVVVPQVPKATVPNSPSQVKPSNSSSTGRDAPKKLSNKEQARQFDWANANFGSPFLLYPEYLITTGDIVDKTIDQIRQELQEEYGYKDAPNLSKHMNDNELAEYMFNNRKSTLNYFSLHHTRYDQKTADVLCFLNHCCPGIMDKNWSGTFTFDNNEGTYKPSSISNLKGWLKNIRESFITNIKE